MANTEASGTVLSTLYIKFFFFFYINFFNVHITLGIRSYYQLQFMGEETEAQGALVSASDHRAGKG